MNMYIPYNRKTFLLSLLVVFALALTFGVFIGHISTKTTVTITQLHPFPVLHDEEYRQIIIDEADANKIRETLR